MNRYAYKSREEKVADARRNFKRGVINQIYEALYDWRDYRDNYDPDEIPFVAFNEMGNVTLFYKSCEQITNPEKCHILPVTTFAQHPNDVDNRRERTDKIEEIAEQVAREYLKMFKRTDLPDDVQYAVRNLETLADSIAGYASYARQYLRSDYGEHEDYITRAQNAVSELCHYIIQHSITTQDK